MYRNANQINPELSKTVVVTASNYGYHHFLHNYKCFMDRLQFKVLVFSFDHKLHHHITHKMNSKTAGSLFYSFYWEGTSDQKVILETPTHFRSPQFNLITNRKQYVGPIIKSLSLIKLLLVLKYCFIFLFRRLC